MNNIVVIKCGGSTVEALDTSFFEGIKKLQQSGKQPIIVHGGGPMIKTMLTKLDIQSEFVDGLRKTTAEVLDVVEMVLSGKVNKWLVHELGKCGVNAIGISGVDGKLLEAEAIDLAKLGFVGDVINVNSELIHSMLEKSYVPVIAPIGVGEKGERFNINADTAAGAVARNVSANELMFVTDVPGILVNDKLVDELSVEEVNQLIDDKVIYGGMIPKVTAAVKSLTGSLNEVIITSGKNLEVNEHGKIVGTKIKNVVEVV